MKAAPVYSSYGSYISHNPWHMPLRDYLDSFDTRPWLSRNLRPGSLEHGLVELMAQIGLPRDPRHGYTGRTSTSRTGRGS